jgi:adenylate cyclase
MDGPHRDAPSQAEGVGSPPGLTGEEVAHRAATTPEPVRELVDLGVLTQGSNPDAPFRRGDPMRVQLVEELEAFGIPPMRVAAAIADGALSLSYLDFSRSASALEPDTFRAVRRVGNLIRLARTNLCGVRAATSAGRGIGARRRPGHHLRASAPVHGRLGEAEILRAARVWGEGVRRVAQHQVHSFHELVEEPFRRQGLTDDQALAAALSQVGVRLIPYVRRLVGWLYGRHFERYATEHWLGHIEAALETAGLHRRRLHPEACVFADLSGYTRLTEELGDEAAAQMALRLAELMQEVADRHCGLVVKMLGDGVHFYFEEPSNAVLGSLELVERAQPQGLPPAHVGVNAGPMTYTDGTTTDLRSSSPPGSHQRPGLGRSSSARPRPPTTNPRAMRYEEVGPVPLKGVARPVKIYRAFRAAT